ncbi:MAG: molybdenum cofactor guanylyltransferase [Caldimicrobium sp.]
MKKVALILAGGKGERIGGKKPLKELAGKPLLYWAIYPYYKLNLPIWISVRTEDQEREFSKTLASLGFQPSSFEFIFDHSMYEGLGPLSGIYSAMQRSDASTLFVVSAADQPFIPKEIVRYLLSLGEIFFSFSIVFKGKDSLEPFPGVYPSTLLSEVQSFLKDASKKSVKGLINFLLRKKLLFISDFWHKIEKYGLLFYNVNTLEELREAEECFLTFIERIYQEL